MFVLQQPCFALQSAGVTRQASVRANHAVARNDDGHAVLPVGIGHGAHGGRPAEPFGLFAVAGGFAVRNLLQALPHGGLKRRGRCVQSHAERVQAACKIFAQFLLSLCQMFVRARNHRPFQQPLQILLFAFHAAAADKFQQAEPLFSGAGNQVAQRAGENGGEDTGHGGFSISGGAIKQVRRLRFRRRHGLLHKFDEAADFGFHEAAVGIHGV